MKGIITLFKIRETYIGIAAAILFQLIFFIVWMTAYDGINDRSSNLKIGIVNDDEIIGENIVQQIEQNIPFQVEMYTSLNEAQSDMNERKIEMIIEIPTSFTDSIHLNNEATIVYWINQANSTLTKTMMENISLQLNNNINKGLFAQQKNEAVMFTEQLQIPEQLTTSITSMLNTLNDHPIEADIQKTNVTEGFAANLVPLMIIISSFVGAMVMIMQHEIAAQSVKSILSKWELFLSRQLINIGVSLFLPVLTISLMNIFDITSQQSLLTIYLFQSLLFLAFLLFAQVFVLVFGNPGMVFNILALSLQLVTSGVLVPKELLSEWYMRVASFLPATYGADGYYTIVFGGSSTNIFDNIQSLLVIIVVTLTITTVTTALKRNQKEEVLVGDFQH